MMLTHHKKPTILHLLGNTGAGKTTMMDLLYERNTDAVAHISVGRELRKRYSPDYFNGQAAPEKTEVEALELYDLFIYVNKHKPQVKLIVVDGQPRKASQVSRVLSLHPDCPHHFMLVHADHEVRARRLVGRDGDDPEKMRLAMARLDNDYRNQYECMIELARLKQELQIVIAALPVGHLVREIEHVYL